MTVQSVTSRLIKRIRDILATDSTITGYVGTRIYAAHLSTIQDVEYPAISIHLMSTGGRDTGGAFMDNFLLQIEPWFQGVEPIPYTWDDMVLLHEKILDVLHRVKGTDTSTGLKVLEITNINSPEQITDPDGTMHYPSLWRVKATT